MSTMIYDAYRVKDPTRAFSLLWDIQDIALANVEDALQAHYLDLVIDMDPDEASYKKAWKERGRSDKEALFRLSRVRDRVRDEYKKNCTSPYRDTYSLDVTVALYPRKGEFYLRTFCESASVLKNVLDFVPGMTDLLEDFHYQNQTDKPENVSQRAWNQREKIWDDITAYKGIGRHVALDIVSWPGFHHIDPWLKLAKAWQENPPELPIREEVWAKKLRGLKRVVEASAVKGRIVVNGGEALVFRRDRRWYSAIGGVEKLHKSLNHAADEIYFELLPEFTKQMVRSLMERAKQDQERREAAKDKK